MPLNPLDRTAVPFLALYTLRPGAACWLGHYLRGHIARQGPCQPVRVAAGAGRSRRRTRARGRRLAGGLLSDQDAATSPPMDAPSMSPARSRGKWSLFHASRSPVRWPGGTFPIKSSRAWTGSAPNRQSCVLRPVMSSQGIRRSHRLTVYYFGRGLSDPWHRQETSREEGTTSRHLGRRLDYLYGLFRHSGCCPCYSAPGQETRL